jgi:dihydropteroate synthase
MITLSALAALAVRNGAHASTLSPVPPVRVGRAILGGDEPALMATVNLSRDSTYRPSIATSQSSAVRKARIAWAEGAAVVDIGAESSTASAARVDPRTQAQRLTPVIEACTAEGIAISVEGYDPGVIAAGLQAGAVVVNLTGRAHEDQIYELAAEYEATVILCYVGGDNVRDITDVQLDADPIPGLMEHFTARITRAQAHGVTALVIDPGMGFYYGNLVDPMTRVRHQARVLLQSFRLRELGFPICHALPHAFDLFEDRYREAEAFFAVLATLGGASLLRTHEVASVAAVTRAMRLLDVDQP